jgi:uncharacterized protein with von Willebrand factor type A (vWA) domain
LVFLEFFGRLREVGLKVTSHEWLALMEALRSGAVEPGLTSFYYTARALLVKRESDLDRFDQAFGAVFRGATIDPSLLDPFHQWLTDPKAPVGLTEEERAALEALDLDKLRELFEQRMREQTERHDGGSKWIGTGGTSPFGHGGTNPAGVRVGGAGGGGRAMQIASRRDFVNYRDDVVLDVRQVQLALRKLRRLTRVGERLELDIDKTVEKTGKNAGELELAMRAPRRNTIRLTLMMDAGGSMTPFAQLLSTLFSAASKSSHWKRFEAYYFHNCVYEAVYTDIAQRKEKLTSELIASATEGSVLIFVGDATMHPSELLERHGSIDYWHRNETPGYEWLQQLRRAIPASVWLNPMQESWWTAPTCQLVRRVFPMYPLTLAGLDRMVADLRSGRVHATPPEPAEQLWSRFVGR